jgi:hypothetical protein
MIALLKKIYKCLPIVKVAFNNEINRHNIIVDRAHTANLDISVCIGYIYSS